MTPLDDQFLPDEAKKTAVKLRKTTANLVRHFQAPALQLKLKASLGEARSSEFATLIDSFEQMKRLWWTKLTTPLEEVNSIKEQLRILQSRTQKLREIHDQKKEHLQKYEEESKEQKEQREYEIQNLKTTIGSENANKEKELKELNEISRQQHEQLENQHKEEVTALKKKIDTLDGQLNQVKSKNKAEETKLREEYKKADRLYSENLNNYDQDMKEQSRNKEQANAQFEQAHHELDLINDEYRTRIEERKKRDELLAIMKQKNEEQLKQMNLLNKAAEWVQGHWRGLLARREMEKARKGKKKKKKK
ncbi:hypothetical protein FGO68_gene2506 [Halteria grandinella]|uniref:Dynein regulatory complex protein 10 n=1 Tax=Halteria grandinella TaxID=5974 RepID=A0A8J8P2W0_HALGN|nr:hypothetical protein FGO68_gene2506 [Halteria grandinella]